MTAKVQGAFIGTSGFSYPEWKPSFYPEKLPNKKMLSFYASVLRSVEINNTFYRLPRKEVLLGWAEQTPESFRFAVKASRRITHFKKLRDSADLLGFLFGGLVTMGERLGPVLFQQPPTMRADVGLLRDFLSSARELAEAAGFGKSGVAPFRPAFEFRHPSWFTDEVFQVLGDGGGTLVSGDWDEEEKDPPLEKTADFVYLRLRKTAYEPEELVTWARRLEALGAPEVFAYFKHEVLGPSLAAQLEGLIAPKQA